MAVCSRFVAKKWLLTSRTLNSILTVRTLKVPSDTPKDGGADRKLQQILDKILTEDGVGQDKTISEDGVGQDKTISEDGVGQDKTISKDGVGQDKTISKPFVMNSTSTGSSDVPDFINKDKIGLADIEVYLKWLEGKEASLQRRWELLREYEKKEARHHKHVTEGLDEILRHLKDQELAEGKPAFFMSRPFPFASKQKLEQLREKQKEQNGMYKTGITDIVDVKNNYGLYYIEQQKTWAIIAEHLKKKEKSIERDKNALLDLRRQMGKSEQETNSYKLVSRWPPVIDSVRVAILNFFQRRQK